MFRQALTIAGNAFLESIRQPIYFVIVMLSGVLQLFNTWGTAFSMGRSSTAEVSGDNKLLLDVGLATVFVSAALLAAFTATAVLSREIEDKTVLTVVSKPIGRPIVVIGKYLGVSLALLLATVTMLTFLLMGVRHGVMSTAADQIDMPVVVFTASAITLSLGIALWGNFFYGWVFPQTAMLVMMPAMVLAYVLVLFVSKDWAIQPLYHFQYTYDGRDYKTLDELIHRKGFLSPDAIAAAKNLVFNDFKPQITLVCLILLSAVLVLSAIALAASTRLGQVMTITVCSGVFLLGLLSNYLIGRHAFLNDAIGVIQEASPLHPEEASFDRPGQTYRITLERPPDERIASGTPFYYGPNPNGYPMAVPAFAPFTGDPTSERDLLGEQTPPGLIVTDASFNRLTIRLIGGRPLHVRRPPRVGDFAFTEPAKVSPLALGIWSVIPNMQFFWLIDAVSQNQPIPPEHVALVIAYAIAQIGVYLALSVVLFQRRDVG